MYLHVFKKKENEMKNKKKKNRLYAIALASALAFVLSCMDHHHVVAHKTALKKTTRTVPPS